MNETNETVTEIEPVEDAPVGDGVLDVPPDGYRRTDGNGRSGTPAPTSLSPEMAEDHAIRAHFDRIWQEAEAFSQQVEGFDLAKELEDDGFAALLSPQRGLTLEQAYFVRHGRALLAAAERAAAARVSAALQASRRVPASARRRSRSTRRLPLGSECRREGERSPQSAHPPGREDLPRKMRRTDCRRCARRFAMTPIFVIARSEATWQSASPKRDCHTSVRTGSQ